MMDFFKYNLPKENHFLSKQSQSTIVLEIESCRIGFNGNRAFINVNTHTLYARNLRSSGGVKVAKGAITSKRQVSSRNCIAISLR